MVKKAKKAKAAAPLTTAQEQSLDILLEFSDDVPFAPYMSAVSIHAILLLFTAAYFPRTSSILGTPLESVHTTSLDRPQHPFLVELTASPLFTVASLCVGLGVLQAWWAGWLRNSWLDVNYPVTNDETRAQKVKLNNQKLHSIIQACWTTFLGSVVFHVVLILFGAPILSYTLHTYSLALLLSILVLFPPLYAIGSPLAVPQLWNMLFVQMRTRTCLDRAMVYPTWGALIGAWLGAIPIALDWDRPWQAWPLTPAYGGIFGYVLAVALALGTNVFLRLADIGRRAEKLQ